MYRSAYNVTISGTAADVTYASLALLGDTLEREGLDAMVVNVVQVEAAEDQAEKVKTVLETAMLEGFRRVVRVGGREPEGQLGAGCRPSKASGDKWGLQRARIDDCQCGCDGEGV